MLANEAGAGDSRRQGGLERTSRCVVEPLAMIGSFGSQRCRRCIANRDLERAATAREVTEEHLAATANLLRGFLT